MNTFPQRAGFSVPASEGKSKSKRLTLSLVHLEALSERQRGVTGLTTASCGAEGCKVLCLVDDFDEPISKRLQGRKTCVIGQGQDQSDPLERQKHAPLLAILTFHWLVHRRGWKKKK